jgi:hypothetical protein
MRKILTLLALISSSAFADINDIKSANNQVGIQLNSSYVDYKESYTDGNTADTEKGWIPGFGLSLSGMKDIFLGNDYFKAQYNHMKGDLDYLGSLNGCVGGCVVNTYEYTGAYGSYAQSNKAKISDFNFRYGKGFEINDQFLLTPYGEVGHHKWNRDLGSNCSVAVLASCLSSEKYTHYYYGIGALVQYSPMQKWVLTADGFLGHTFSSEISGTGRPIVVAGSAVFDSFSQQDLGNKSIYRIGLNADYAFTDKIHGNIGLDYIDFKYGKSDIFNTYTYEPDSKTNYTNVKVGIGYAF